MMDPDSPTAEYLEQAVSAAGVITIPRIVYDALIKVTVQHSHIHDITVAVLVDHRQEVNPDTLEISCSCGRRYDPRTDPDHSHALHIADQITDLLDPIGTTHTDVVRHG